MKKILFLTPFVPSSRAGGENFTRLLLENLSKNNKIDLVYFRYRSDPVYKTPNENVRILKTLLNSTFVKLKHTILHPFMHPIFSIRFSWRLLHDLQRIVAAEQYDVMYLDHSQMFLYGKYFPNLKKVLMSHDVMAQRYSRVGNVVSRNMVFNGEGSLMKIPNSTVFTFSEKDCEIVKACYGIDSYATNFFLDPTTVVAFPEKVEKRLVFFGKWDRADNFDGLKWFFDNVYNRIGAEYKISIIGKWLSEEFQNRLQSLENVEYLGFVDNPYTMIANSMATLSPLFSGAGVKVKVVESLACGTPVIGNDITFEGISSQFSEFMLKAESADDYIRIIQNLTISLEHRVNFKKLFMEKYQKQSIESFVNEL